MTETQNGVGKINDLSILSSNAETLSKFKQCILMKAPAIKF